MKRVKRKLMMTCMSVALLVVATISTTYAWFSLNDSAWIEDFELNIINTDNLLIKYEDGPYKQAFSNEDVVAAINSLRTEGNKIDSLNDIKLTPVTSFDGASFKKPSSSFDDSNIQTISYVDADINSFVVMKLYFTVEANGSESASTVHPNYELKLKQVTNDQTGVRGTSFKSPNQDLKLVNSLVTFGLEEEGLVEITKKQGDTLTVNPVNALRFGIKNANDSNIDFIYDVAEENDLGSYAFDERVLKALEKDVIEADPAANVDMYSDFNYLSRTNAMFTYYNNIVNNCLKPMGYYSNDAELATSKTNVSGLLNKLKYGFNDSLGVLKYDQTSQSYNTLELTFAIWIEGFDADNLIGLNTSVLNSVLSFDMIEVQE